MDILFDIVIPTYNNVNELQACLKGLERQTLRDFRVFVCVDGSTDNTIDFLHSYIPSYPMHTLTHPDGMNRGRNAARNLVLNHCNAPYLLMLDSDLVPEPDCLQKHLDLLKKHDCVSLGDVIYKNRRSSSLAAYVQSRGKNKFKSFETIPCYYFNSPNTAMRSIYFTKCGGQDENMIHYGGGDVEFGCRLYKKTLIPFIYNPSAVVTGIFNKSLEKILEQMREFGAINLRYILKKHPEFKKAFGAEHLESSSVQSFFFRMLLSSPIEWFIKKTIGIL